MKLFNLFNLLNEIVLRNWQFLLQPLTSKKQFRQPLYKLNQIDCFILFSFLPKPSYIYIRSPINLSTFNSTKSYERPLTMTCNMSFVYALTYA